MRSQTKYVLDVQAYDYGLANLERFGMTKWKKNIERLRNRYYNRIEIDAYKEAIDKGTYLNK